MKRGLIYLSIILGFFMIFLAGGVFALTGCDTEVADDPSTPPNGVFINDMCWNCDDPTGDSVCPEDYGADCSQEYDFDCVACDNGRCDPGEDSTNCLADCPLPGCDSDGTCSDGESCTSCSADCGECIIDPNCGEGTVDSGEECDDGNNLNDDGCSMVCTTEEIPPTPCSSDDDCNIYEICDLSTGTCFLPGLGIIVCEDYDDENSCNNDDVLRFKYDWESYVEAGATCEIRMTDFCAWDAIECYLNTDVINIDITDPDTDVRGDCNIDTIDTAFENCRYDSIQTGDCAAGDEQITVTYSLPEGVDTAACPAKDPRVVICPEGVQLPFFSLFSAVSAVAVIIFVYAISGILRRKKKLR